MPIPKILQFLNPQHHTGTNVTVRRGIKWAGETSAWVEGLDAPPKDLQTRVLRYADLTKTDIQAEHDPECRTLPGLWNAMRRAYPDFDAREIVTLVCYQIKSNERMIHGANLSQD